MSLNDPPQSTSPVEPFLCLQPVYIPQSQHATVDIENLRSNRLPSEAEASRMCALLKVESLELQNIEQEIRRVRQILAELERRGEYLSQEIRRRQSWLSPIRRLPVEVIEKIFAQTCLGDGAEEFSLDIHSVDREKEYSSYIGRRGFFKRSVAITCVLSQVSHHWRKVTTASPRLWSSLSLDVTKMDKGHAALINLYVLNSASYPLNLSLYGKKWGYDYFQHDNQNDAINELGHTGFTVLRSLIQNALHRCSQLRYNFPNDDLLAFVGTGTPTQFTFPFLSHFCDCTSRARVNPDSHWFWQSIKTAPQLNRLTIEKYAVPKVDYFPKRLRSLHIKGRDSGLPSIEGIGSLSLPHLRSMVIDTPSLSDVDEFFAALYVPSLSSVKLDILPSGTLNFLHVVDGVHMANTQSLQSMLQRSHIQDLDICFPFSTVSPAAIIALLQSIPNLVRFKLDYVVSEMQPSIIPLLCFRMSMPPPSSSTQHASRQEDNLLPRLQQLSVREIWDEGPYDANVSIANVECITAMLESRPIGDVSVTFTSLREQPGPRIRKQQLPSDLAPRIQALRLGGARRFFLDLPLVRMDTPNSAKHAVDCKTVSS
ncbi:hypothetical protein VNI00_007831 [Paramarasmius palmivorus]|uniref:F-box domain-containing protein n=1 Tax=Paramarasmius palmivorus TaxID=297713 RepID=A0AAW0CXW1_9AGAR